MAVIGCGGSGKTTLSRALGRRLGLPVVHIDGHYWHGRPGVGGVEPTYAEWSRLHAELVAGERWVIDGMKLGVLEARLAAAETVVFLDLSTRACLWGMARRRVRYRGRARPDLGVYDEISVAFVRWVLGFRRRVRPQILSLLAVCSCEVVHLRSHKEARGYLDSLVGPDGARAAGATVEATASRPPPITAARRAPT